MISEEFDEGFICREYNTAADKNKQVRILAELNDCSKEVILEILSRNGAISGVPIKKKQRKHQASRVQSLRTAVKASSGPLRQMLRYQDYQRKGYY